MKYNVYYKINWGDTLESIAEKFDIDLYSLKYYNNLHDFYMGKIIAIPKEVNITVRPSMKTIEYILQRHAAKTHLFKFYR